MLRILVALVLGAAVLLPAAAAFAEDQGQMVDNQYAPAQTATVDVTREGSNQ